MRSTVNKSWMLAVAFLGLCRGRLMPKKWSSTCPSIRRTTADDAGWRIRCRTGRSGQDALLIRRTKGVGNSAVIVLTTPASAFDPSGDKPALTFTRDEDAYRLSTNLGVAHRGSNAGVRLTRLSYSGRAATAVWT